MAGVPAAFIAFMSFIAALAGEHLTTSNTSPVQIFVQQFTDAFGRPPSLPATPLRPVRPLRKRVYVTRPS